MTHSRVFWVFVVVTAIVLGIMIASVAPEHWHRIPNVTVTLYDDSGNVVKEWKNCRREMTVGHFTTPSGKSFFVSGKYTYEEE